MRSRPSATLTASLLALVGAYRRWLSPLLPPACRFYPSCSEYARDAVVQHGALRGLALAAKRLARCHPWCEGGLDPVPSASGSPRGNHRAAPAEVGR